MFVKHKIDIRIHSKQIVLRVTLNNFVFLINLFSILLIPVDIKYIKGINIGRLYLPWGSKSQVYE